MNVLYDLEIFERTIGQPITIKRGLILKSGKIIDEYIQGVLVKVDIEKDLIEIEQYFTFLNYLNNEKDVPSKISEFRNSEFELVSNLFG